MKSPAELMFGRNIRDKIPTLNHATEILDEEIRDRDKTMKEKGKAYGDNIRHAIEREIKEGDLVLIKRQVKTNKLDANFENRIYKVVERKGNEVTVENVDTKTRYKRNVAHLKTIPENKLTSTSLSNHSSHSVQEPVMEESISPQSTFVPPKHQPLKRPLPSNVGSPNKRVRRTPRHFSDYVTQL